MTTETTTTLVPGEFSSGTLRDEDLLDMFDTIGVIVGCGQCRTDATDGLDILNEMGAPGDFWSDLAEDSARVSTILDDLFVHVQDRHTPEGYWFGASEGDGASFGVWFDCQSDYWSWICTDCVMLLANAETNPDWSEEEEQRYLDAVDANLEGSQAFLAYTEDGEGSFSCRRCDMCMYGPKRMPTLGGTRHPALIEAKEETT